MHSVDFSTCLTFVWRTVVIKFYLASRSYSICIISNYTSRAPQASEANYTSRAPQASEEELCAVRRSVTKCRFWRCFAFTFRVPFSSLSR